VLKRVVITILVLSLLLIPVKAIFAQEQGQDLGKKVPDFVFKNAQGKKGSIQFFRGKMPVVLIFWESTDPKCKEAIKSLEGTPAFTHQYNKELKPDSVKFIAVNLAEEDFKVKAFIESNKLKIPVVVDPDVEISGLFNVGELPYILVIDKKGIVKYVHSGYKPGDEKTINNEVLKLNK